MKVGIAGADDALELATLHAAVADELTRRFGRGRWSHPLRERGVARALKESTVFVGRERGRIVATARLQARKPWAIDPAYFTPADRVVHLLDMAVLPRRQRHGLGRALLKAVLEAAAAWPADAVRLDAYDAPAGAGEFYRKCGFAPRGSVTYRSTPLSYFECVFEVNRVTPGKRGSRTRRPVG